jgi:hypothetical protein
VTSLTADAFGARFGDLFEHTAWRLETLDYYETTQYARWRAGEPVERGGWDALLQVKSVARVHVVPEVLTGYLEFEIAFYRDSVAAGEDIRLIPAADAQRLELPELDFWIFDDREVAIMRYDAAGVHLGADLVTKPQFVAQCRLWRDLASEHATPLLEFLAGREAA